MLPAEKVLFALSPRPEGGADVVLGVPTAAWEYMKDGKTHTFDLTKLGLPIRIIMCGGADLETIGRWIEAHNARLGLATQDRRGEDFSIEDKRTPP
jgi:hypothetical protein